MLLLEFDKAGAEWVVVAYLSGDARMIDVIESGKSPHVVTGAIMSRVPEHIVAMEDKSFGKVTDPDKLLELRKEHFPEFFTPGLFIPRTMTIRQCGKKSNHGLNYDEGYRTFALNNEIEEWEAKIIVNKYREEVYPGVPLWHGAVRDELKDGRTLTDLLGNKVRLLGEWGGELFRQAYSYKPQSTVVGCVNEAMRLMYSDETPEFYKADLLTQTHDSVTTQYPTDDFTGMAKFAIRLGLEYMSPKLHFNGRDFHIKTDLKCGLNWGHMIEVPLVPDIKDMENGLRFAWQQLREAVQ